MYFQSNVLLLVNLNNGTAGQIQLSSFFNMASSKISNAFKSKNYLWKMKTDLTLSHNQIVFYTYNSDKIEVIDLHSMSAYTINLPFDVESVLLPSEKKWLIQDTSKNNYILKKSDDSFPCPSVLQYLEEYSESSFKVGSFLSCTTNNLHTSVLSAALQEKIDSPNRLIVTDSTYASIAVGFPDLDSTNELHFWPRSQKSTSFTSPIIMESGEIVRTVLPDEVPDDVFPNNGKHFGITGYLEIVDIMNHKLRYVPIPE